MNVDVNQSQAGGAPNSLAATKIQGSTFFFKLGIVALQGCVSAVQ